MNFKIFTIWLHNWRYEVACRLFFFHLQILGRPLLGSLIFGFVLSVCFNDSSTEPAILVGTVEEGQIALYGG